jgi:hypothetical protein
MTDPYMYPTSHIVDAAMSSTESMRVYRESNRVEKCKLHRGGQFAKHLCPDCSHLPGRREYDNHHPERVERQRAVYAAAKAILAERTPTSYNEFAFLIHQRTGLNIRACHAGEVLKWMRRRGETTVLIQNEQTRKLAANSKRRLDAAAEVTDG